jgi:hypothetical protein
MNIKFRLSVVVVVMAAMSLVPNLSASAQDINFTCSGATVTLVGGVACGVAPAGLLTYTADGVEVTGDGGLILYNPNQGDQYPGGPPEVGTPALSGGTGSSKPAQAVVTVQETSGAAFQFDSVDLLATTGTLTYTITGISAADGSTLNFASGSLTHSSNGGDYSTIGDGGDTAYITSLTITLTDSNGVDRLNLINLPEGGPGFMFLLLAGGACCGTMLFFKPRLAA